MSQQNKDEKLKLNLNAKEWVPKSKPAVPNQSSSTPLQMQGGTAQRTPLKLNLKCPSFMPKGFKNIKTQNEAPKNEPPKKVIRDYFIIDEENKKKYIFDFDYMISFEKWEICSETKLLSEELLKHLEDFKVVETEAIKGLNKYDKKGRKENRKHDKGEDKKEQFQRNENTEISKDMKQWGRKDLTKELASAEAYMKKIEEENQKDPIRFQLTEYLNMLTVDNYDETSQKILEIIKDSLEYQEKFLDVLFIKAVNEKAFVFLYAKLCKEFDKVLPQKNTKNVTPPKKPTSMLRVKLLDKCREIFKIQNNEKFDEYIKVSDPEERELKLKRFVLGNVNFIAELINIQILSKKIVFQCIKNLFTRFEDSGADKSLKLINLEAIVILMDKFGTLLKNKQSKIKEEDKKNFNENIKIYMSKLETVEKEITGHIKYKIINLIERSNNNWEESKYAKSVMAKGKKDILAESEQEKQYSQETITDKINKDLNSFKEHIFILEGTPKNYNWSIVEDIHDAHGNSIAEIIQGFLESCIDFVQNEKLLNLVSDYFLELISYYKSSLYKEEKIEISKKTMHLIRVASDFKLDNPQIIDVWSIILGTLIKSHIVFRDDLCELDDLGEEELKDVFAIIAKSIKKDPQGKVHYDKCEFIKTHEEMYKKALDKYVNN